MLNLSYPVDPQLFPICHGFWVDETNNPAYQNFYTVFDNHHPGVDFDTLVGTKIVASFPGIVVRNEFHKGMGNVVSVRNGNIIALYAHLESSLVDLGQILTQTETVGISGNTGMATTDPHLHFELRNLEHKILKESVFEPVFNSPISRYKESFIHEVNNTNTQKTLGILALRYFGDSKYVDKLKITNLKFGGFKDDEPLPDNEPIIIPNYI